MTFTLFGMRNKTPIDHAVLVCKMTKAIEHLNDQDVLDASKRQAGYIAAGLDAEHTFFMDHWAVLAEKHRRNLANAGLLKHCRELDTPDEPLVSG